VRGLMRSILCLCWFTGCDAKSMVDADGTTEEDTHAPAEDTAAGDGSGVDTGSENGGDEADSDTGESTHIDTGPVDAPDTGESDLSTDADADADDAGDPDETTEDDSGASDESHGSGGEGPSHGLAPVALCSVRPPSVIASLESADWVGSESYDPFAFPLTYEWTLIVAPEGSMATMPEGDAERLGFFPDLPGDYVGRLVVTNSMGMASVPCEVRLNAVPPDRPIAICDVAPNPIRPLLDTADWLGNESYDPAALPLTYDWTLLVGPDGSTATMPEGDADRLGFVADLEGAYTAQLVVTNSAGVPSTPCTTTLNVVPNQPVAVCEVAPNPIRPLIDSADWLGSGSYDPDGLTLSYDWTLVEAPPGSSVSMPFGGADRLGFVPELAGYYVGRLIVTNSAGVVSEPCETRLEAIPGENLWIEMFWTHSGDDMDLHLLAPGGVLTTGSDCYYGNCTWGLEWGSPGTADNPYLDLDDISGTGPENINIESPADGIFTVVVHDYPGSVYSAGNPVTVNIYLDGALAWTDTRSISVEGSYNNFAQINTATGSVMGL
jgi:hypothetical protein